MQRLRNSRRVTLIHSAEHGVVAARFEVDHRFHEQMKAEEPYLQYVREQFGAWIATELTGRIMWRILTA
ncbi:hypothetical protein [Nocardia phage P3.1]|nr:hypothetical protein [Nocardia phage P3.1]